jgi:hypothetical protein
VAATAVVVSQIAIAQSWHDARAGTIVNAVVLAGAVVGFAVDGPRSLAAAYAGDVARRLADPGPTRLITEADLDRLPSLVQSYLRRAGVVGSPLVRNFRATMRGTIRSGVDAPWIPFRAEQYNFLDEPARFFYMTASRLFVPFHGFHRYAGSEATMRVKLAGLLTVAEASGDDMARAETVTMLNDMCLLAPASLVDPRIDWEDIDARTVRAIFANAGHIVRATLMFDAAGDLVDFVSDDRLQMSEHGVRRLRWSTPVDGYKTFGPFRVVGGGAGLWHDRAGMFPYIRIEIEDVQYNVTVQ